MREVLRLLRQALPVELGNGFQAGFAVLLAGLWLVVGAAFTKARLRGLLAPFSLSRCVRSQALQRFQHYGPAPLLPLRTRGTVITYPDYVPIVPKRRLICKLMNIAPVEHRSTRTRHFAFSALTTIQTSGSMKISIMLALVIAAALFGKRATIALLRWAWPSMGGGGN